MGRPTKNLPPAELMGLIAHAKLNESVIGKKRVSLKELNLKPIHWEKLNIRQKLMAANITLNRSNRAFCLHINLSPSSVQNLSNPRTAQKTFDYIRDQVTRAFKACGEPRPMYWYVMENLRQGSALPNTSKKRHSNERLTCRPHIHAGFTFQNSNTDINKLTQLLRKSVGGGRHKAIMVKTQGTEEPGKTIREKTLDALIWAPDYAMKNLCMQTLYGVSRPYVLSRPLQQETLNTLCWLSS